MPCISWLSSGLLLEVILDQLDFSAKDFDEFINQYTRTNALAAISPVKSPQTHTPTLDDVITYVSHVDRSGKADVRITDAVNHHAVPADYHPTEYPTEAETRKFGSPKIGTKGGVVNYNFDKASHYTETEKAAFRVALADWSNVANIQFKETAALQGKGITFIRPVDKNAHPGNTHWSTIGNADIAGDGSIASTITHAEITIKDKAVGPIDTSNHYAIGVIAHEIGHAIGLSHSGKYNGTVDGMTAQNGPYDSHQWSIMSYLNADDPKARYYGDPAMSERNAWTPYTPMIADVAAVQRLYGKPVGGALTGGQTFGFNSNVKGPESDVLDFKINHDPRVTIYDSGIDNTVDLSGYTHGAKIDLTPGTFISASPKGTMIDNIGIAFGTKIDHVVGTQGNDTIIKNVDLKTVMKGGGGNDTFESTLKGFDGSTIADLNIGDKIHFTDAAPSSFHFADLGKLLTFGDKSSSYHLAMTNDPSGRFTQTADKFGGVDLTLAAASQFA